MTIYMSNQPHFCTRGTPGFVPAVPEFRNPSRTTRILGLCLVGLLPLAGWTQPISCFQVPPGLVAWWPLDDATNQTVVLDNFSTHHGTPRDSNNNTIPVGIPTLWQLPDPAVFNGTLLPVVVDPATSPPRGAFFYSDTYVEVPHHANLNIGTNGLTIVLWVWPSLGSGDPQPLVEKYDLTTTDGYSVYLDPLGPTSFVVRMNLNGTVVTGPTISTSMTPSDWWFVVARVTPGGAVTLGACDMAGNCTNISAVTVPNFLTANTAPLWLGRSVVASPTGMDLRAIRLGMDEVELFGRALSQAEVQTIYAAEVTGLRKCTPAPGSGQLCVRKFHDLDADGTPDPNEPSLPGWQFVVTDAASNVVGVVTSTPPGTVPGCLTLPAGSYTVTETLQPGWTNTTPLSQTVTLQPGQTTNLVFGNMGCFQPPPGLVAWWPLDDAINQTVVQEWIGGLNGTPRNSANVTIPVGIPTLWQLPDPGVFGGTLLPVVVDPSTTPPRGAFFYSDTFVEVPHHANLNIGTNGATIVLWVWPTLGTGGPQPLVEKFDAASTNGYAVWLDNLGSGTFGLRLNLNGTLVTGPSFSVSMQPSDWRFIVVRVAPGGAVVLGACDMVGNCTNSAAVTVANYLTTNTAPFWLARSDVASPAGTVRAIRVGMDEVEMFNRALSQSELQTIYTSELAGLRKCAPPTGVAELCIAKFHDYDGDGIQDPNEPGLAGWSFLLNPAPPGLGTNVVTTGPGGLVCIPVLAPFTYSIAEMIQSGWTNTTPGTQTITTAPGQATNVVFGNMQTPTGMAELCIFKFHDYDGDGVQDPNEPGLAGWQFVVNPAPLSTGTNVVTTLAGGAICMGVSAPGVYTITEIAQSGWTNTTATNLTIAVSPGQLTNLYFGNALTSGPARICVLKYHDWNLNGVHDPGEPVLPGWTILIKDPLGNTNQVVITSTNFVCVTVPAPAVYHVSEVLPPPIGPWVPWTPTSPASGTYSNVTVAPGQTVNLLFGNRKNIKWWPPVVNPSPLRLILRASVEPGESYQLEYRESLDPDAPWIPVGEPVLASEPEVVFEVAIPAAQRQGYYRVKEMLKGNPD